MHPVGYSCELDEWVTNNDIGPTWDGEEGHCDDGEQSGVPSQVVAEPEVIDDVGVQQDGVQDLRNYSYCWWLWWAERDVKDVNHRFQDPQYIAQGNDDDYEGRVLRMGNNSKEQTLARERSKGEEHFLELLSVF